MSRQVGIFFLLVGLVSLVVFCATIEGGQPTAGFLCVGMLGLIPAIYLIGRGYAPPPPSERFRLLRRKKK